MQPASTSPLQTILQPVLQWGDSGTDSDGVNRTGPFWTVASWIVPDATGTVYHTPHVGVNPGQVLIGVMTLTSQTGGLFTYACEFESIAGTDFSVTNMPELVWCVETLEAYEVGGSETPPYDLNEGSEYPNTDKTAFQVISIQANSVIPSLEWAPDNYVTKFGEHTNVASKSSSNGEVDVYYVAAPDAAPVRDGSP